MVAGTLLGAWEAVHASEIERLRHRNITTVRCIAATHDHYSEVDLKVEHFTVLLLLRVLGKPVLDSPSCEDLDCEFNSFGQKDREGKSFTDSWGGWLEPCVQTCLELIHQG